MNAQIQNNRIELHYYLNDDSHAINAFILNKSEWELINLLKEIASAIDIDIDIESEAISEGGLVQKFRVSIKKCKEGSINYGLLMILLTGLIGTPLSVGATKLIESLFENEDDIQLEQQKKKIEIAEGEANIEYLQAITENTKVDTKRKEIEVKLYSQKLIDNTKIAKRSSSFYESISKENKIDKISVKLIDKEGIDLSREQIIHKSDFPKYILSTNELPTITDEKAVIEIVSPVLNKGKYQWKGIYNSEILNFNMQSSEFKTNVQSGEIEFKNGTCIICILEMPRIINNMGEEVITARNIKKVLSYYNIDNVLKETKEGSIYRRKKELDIAQLDLFSNEIDSAQSAATNDNPTR